VIASQYLILNGKVIVGMAGTAVKLKNVEILGVEKLEKMNEVKTVNERYLHIMKFTIEEF
jgi:hypothetical protein